MRCLLVSAIAVAAIAVWARAQPQADGAALVPAPKFVLAWGEEGEGDGEFRIPIGVAVERDGRVLVTDLRNKRVQRFTADGKFVAAVPTPGQPGGIAVGADGTVYVSLFDKDRIAALAPDGRLLREWGKSGRGDGEVRFPAGLVVGPDGAVYLGDDVNRRVQRFTPEGKFLAAFGKAGTGPGEFGGPGTDKLHPDFRTSGPSFLAFGPDGLLYATDARGGRVHRFKADGTVVSAWGSNEDKPGGFGGRPKNLPGPTGVAVDVAGRVWVAATNNRVQAFTTDGVYLGGFGGAGDGDGEFHTPHGLAVRGDSLYVVDTRNQRVQKFDLGPAKR